MLLRTAACGPASPRAADAGDAAEPRTTDDALAAVLAVAAALRVDADARAELLRMIAAADAACPGPSGAQRAASDDSAADG